MALTNRGNRELQTKSREKLKNATDPMEKLRLQCLSRGATGIKGLGRAFKIYDDDGNNSLDFREFNKGVNDYGCDLCKEEVQSIFDSLDKDKSGTLDFDEFLIALRPPMTKSRVALVIQAFNKLDKTKDGFITVEDLKGVYNVSKHPKYISGEKTEEELFLEFLKNFEAPEEIDGKVTKEEFLNYYSGVSASIDNDAYFDLMMRNAYKFSTGKVMTDQITKREFLNYYSAVSCSIDNDAYFDLMMRNAYKL